MKKKTILLLIGLITCLSFSFTFKASYGVLSQDWIVTANFINDYPTGLDIDSSSNIYVAGYMDNFNGSKTDVEGFDASIFLLKYDSLGTQQWNKTYNISRSDKCFDLAVGNQGNVYLVADAYSADLLLMKYDSSGNLQWNITGAKNIRGISIKIDSSNNIFLSGNKQLCNIFLRKYDSSGNLLWNRTWETPERETVVSMDLDSSNNIYIGANTHITGVCKNISLVKYNSLGEFQWNFTYQTSTDDYCTDIVVDSLDNIYVLGNILIRSIDQKIWLLKYDSSSNLLWNVTWGDKSTYSVGEGLAIDASDNVYITGSTLVSGSTDILVLKYDSTGDLKWDYTQGVNDFGIGKAIKIDSSENIYICGETNNIADDALDHDNDAFLLKLSETSPQAFISSYNLPIVALSVFGIGIAFYLKKRKSFS